MRLLGCLKREDNSWKFEKLYEKEAYKTFCLEEQIILNNINNDTKKNYLKDLMSGGKQFLKFEESCATKAYKKMSFVKVLVWRGGNNI